MEKKAKAKAKQARRIKRKQEANTADQPDLSEIESECCETSEDVE